MKFWCQRCDANCFQLVGAFSFCWRGRGDGSQPKCTMRSDVSSSTACALHQWRQCGAESLLTSHGPCTPALRTAPSHVYCMSKAICCIGLRPVRLWPATALKTKDVHKASLRVRAAAAENARGLHTRRSGWSNNGKAYPLMGSRIQRFKGATHLHCAEKGTGERFSVLAEGQTSLTQTNRCLCCRQHSAARCFGNDRYHDAVPRCFGNCS